jgi:hypothetical protein
MVVIGEVITAVFRYCMQLMVGQLWKSLAGSHTSTVELVIRIVHLIATEDGFQATLIESLVMGHEGKALYQWLYLFPDNGEYGGLLGVLACQSMNLGTPIIIIVRLWLDQGIE